MNNEFNNNMNNNFNNMNNGFNKIPKKNNKVLIYMVSGIILIIIIVVIFGFVLGNGNGSYVCTGTKNESNFSISQKWTIKKKESKGVNIDKEIIITKTSGSFNSLEIDQFKKNAKGLIGGFNEPTIQVTENTITIIGSTINLTYNSVNSLKKDLLSNGFSCK